MMKMNQMKLVNSGTKFRPRIDKFSQPNSGGPQFQKRARGYIYIHIHRHIHIHIIYTYTYVYVYIYIYISHLSFVTFHILVKSFISGASRHLLPGGSVVARSPANSGLKSGRFHGKAMGKPWEFPMNSIPT